MLPGLNCAGRTSYFSALGALKINDYHARIQISTILYFIG